MLADASIRALARATSISTTESLVAIFFLVSKPEHDNEKWDSTFLDDTGRDVFTYAAALSYDWKQRGVTTGIVGFTSANDGKASWGDLRPVLDRYARLGGKDAERMLSLSETAHKKKADADTLCHSINALKGRDRDLFEQAQIEALCAPGGYVYEATAAIGGLDLPPHPLYVSIVFDTALNFGLGGEHCPRKWLAKNGTRGDAKKTFRAFLEWKASVGSKNNHNSCKHNAEQRSKQFKKLLDKNHLTLPRASCEEAVRWTMK
jgi:hypothetical protein